MPRNPSNQSNPPAPALGAGAKEGEQGSSNTPLPRYLISPQELKLLGWLRNAKEGDRMDLTALLPPPPPPPGAVEINEKTKFYNFRIRYNDAKKTVVLLSGGFTVTVNPLKGARIYKDGRVVREYNDCWATLITSILNVLARKYGFNTFNTKWATVSLPDNDIDVRRFIALIASLIKGREKELKDPQFRVCLGNSSKTPS